MIHFIIRNLSQGRWPIVNCKNSDWILYFSNKQKKTVSGKALTTWRTTLRMSSFRCSAVLSCVGSLTFIGYHSKLTLLFSVAKDDQRAKLTKLLSLWEGKAKFFDACVISKLRSPESSMQEYKTNLMNLHNNIIQQFSKSTKMTFEKWVSCFFIFYYFQIITNWILATNNNTQCSSNMLTRRFSYSSNKF